MKINLACPLILGSKSPRRKELLEQLGLEFTIRNSEIDEEVPSSVTPIGAAVYLAEKKARSLQDSLTQEILLTADTVVIAEGEMLEKPVNPEESYKMLEKLSGKVHEVITGVCLLHNGKYYLESDTTRVYFRDLSDEEIIFYTSKYKPYDKAGGYGIQEWIGLVAIERIEGSYFNVMGLPVSLVYRLLKVNGFLTIK